MLLVRRSGGLGTAGDRAKAEAGGAATAAIYIAILIPIVLFVFSFLSTTGIYTGPGSDLPANTWVAILVVVTVIGITLVLIVYGMSRLAAEESRSPAPGPAPGSRGKVRFSVKEDSPAKDGGSGVKVKAGEERVNEDRREGKGVKKGDEPGGTKTEKPGTRAQPGEKGAPGETETAAEKEKTVKADGGGEGKKGGEVEKAKKEEKAPEDSKPLPSKGVKEMFDRDRSGDKVSFLNRRILEYPPGTDRGIFCETFIQVDEDTVLKFKQKVGEDIYVRTCNALTGR